MIPPDPPPDPPTPPAAFLLDLAYTYDQLGNRLTKTENEALRTTF